MSTYAIGDIQGCYQSFLKLLEKIVFDPSRDRLWLCGDLVNRGPDSLSVLRWVYQHQEQVQIVLGNHELYLLARSQGLLKSTPKETLESLWQASDRGPLINYLLRQPIIFEEGDWMMVHGGILPLWNKPQTFELAEQIHQQLIGHRFKDLLFPLKPDDTWQWDIKQGRLLQLRHALAVFSQIRVCNSQGKVLWKFKGELSKVPSENQPWFRLLAPSFKNKKIIFGHWAALGLYREKNIYAIDSGCVWGGALTALRLEDEKVFQVSCA